MTHGVTGAPRPAWIPAAAAGALFLVYLLTLAPGLTFWDAGEFIAAAATWGVPHPPGTPLYVALLRAWSLLLPVPVEVATNLFSAACTAAAGGFVAWLVLAWGGDGWEAFAAAGVAGTMSSVWLNATETEVYATSLLLAMATIAAGVRAARSRDGRWQALLAYLIVLAVPLHLSALVAAPAAIYAACADADGRLRWRDAVPLAGAALATLGISRMSLWMVLLGVAMGARAAARGRFPLVGAAVGSPPPARRRFLLAGAVAASALLVMWLRARHDPWLNQGDPSSLGALADAVARRQYAIAPLWPRRAPVYLQLANLAQYADWQVALGLGRTIFASLPRLAATLVFLALAAIGAQVHRARDRRGFVTTALLLGAGTLGVLLYLNLQAGPSLGYGIVPDGAHEARERDYFFVLGFVAWGIWAGLGAVALGDRLRQPAAGLALAALPCALNWPAVTRTRHPERELPSRVAMGLLGAAPPNAVFLSAGDNDTYPLWALQSARGFRRDVVVVTVPLLPAGWYRRELIRRHGLLPEEWASAWPGDPVAMRALGLAVRRQGRALVASPQLSRADRERVAPAWILRGPVFVAATLPEGERVGVDTVASLAWSRTFERWRRGRDASPSVDPTSEWWLHLLSCPGALARPRAAPVQSQGAQALSDSLESTCNLR